MITCGIYGFSHNTYFSKQNKTKTKNKTKSGTYITRYENKNIRGLIYEQF